VVGDCCQPASGGPSAPGLSAGDPAIRRGRNAPPAAADGTRLSFELTATMLPAGTPAARFYRLRRSRRLEGIAAAEPRRTPRVMTFGDVDTDAGTGAMSEPISPAEQLARVSCGGLYVRSKAVVSAWAQPDGRRRRLRCWDQAGFAERHTVLRGIQEQGVRRIMSQRPRHR